MMVKNPISPRQGTSPDNLSTQHQPPGSATRPRDILDKDATKKPPARDYDPGSDAGNPLPGDDGE